MFPESLVLSNVKDIKDTKIGHVDMSKFLEQMQR